jgi:hypothetical protein
MVADSKSIGKCFQWRQGLKPKGAAWKLIRDRMPEFVADARICHHLGDYYVQIPAAICDPLLAHIQSASILVI